MIDKKKDAELAFNSWKMQKKEEMKQKQEKLQAKEEKEKDQPEVLLLVQPVQPSEEADGDDKTAETREPSVTVIEQKRGPKTDSKLEDAKLAYEAWLDYIEARDDERLMFEEERRKILMWKPPWYPGGKTMF